MRRPIFYALAAAALFGVSAPFSKLLVGEIEPVALAGLLYVGAFLGLAAFSATSVSSGRGAPLSRDDVPWLAGAMAAGGVAAPILLMVGLTTTTGLAASLLLNLEAAATAGIAVLAFREHAGGRLWGAVACMAAGGTILAWDASAGRFDSLGPILIALAMLCWGVDNNLTRRISAKDPVAIARAKCGVAGAVSLAISLALGETIDFNIYLLLAILVGSLSYGASLALFVKALDGLGASRTGALFGAAPFVGAAASLALLREWAGWALVPAFAFMTLGAWLILTERHGHAHRHELTKHAHVHLHDDGHHGHEHAATVAKEHVHEHEHGDEEHDHPHWPDSHHRHGH